MTETHKQGRANVHRFGKANDLFDVHVGGAGIRHLNHNDAGDLFRALGKALNVPIEDCLARIQAITAERDAALALIDKVRKTVG